MPKPKRPNNLEQTLDLGDRSVQVADGLGRLDMDNLLEETEEAGAQCIWFGTLHARARRHAGELRLQRDVQAATLARDYRAGAVQRAEKPPTDKAVADYVLLNPDYQRAYRAHLDAEEKADVLENVKFTLARKQETCRAMAGLITAEHFARRGPDALPRPGSGRTPLRHA